MRSKRHRRRRSHKLLALGIGLLLMVGLASGTGLAYGSVKSQADRLQASLTTYLEAGQWELEAGKASLSEANTKHDATLAGQAVTHFAAARDQFLGAAQLADSSHLLRNLERVPGVNELVISRHRAVNRISEMGVAIAEAGQDLATLDAEIIKPSASGQAGRTLLTVLDEVTTGLVKVKAHFEGARKAASDVQINILPSGQRTAFVKAQVSIAAAIAGLSEFERLAPVLKEALGGKGARTYLVEQVNPAELRAGGGFIGTYSVLRADLGALSVVTSGDSYKLAYPRPRPGQSGFIPQPTPLREVIPDTSWSFVDSNIYPDFPSNAKAAESFVQPRIGPIDGVISMDYYTVAKMLELIGPMYVPSYGIQVDANNFVTQVMKYDVSPSDFGHTDSKAVLSSLAGPFMQRVAALPPDKWPALLSMLNGLATERHLQMYFNSELVESEVDRVGWSGSLNPVGESDFLMEVESNYYGNKTNYFLSRHFSLSLARSGNALHHKVLVDLINNEPCGIEPRTNYRADIRLYVGAQAFSVSDNLGRTRYSNPLPPPGTRVLGGWLYVDCGGGRGQAVFDYDTPWPGHDKAGVQIYWQKQPGTIADGISVSWNSAYHAAADLRQDKIVTLLPAGVSLAPGQPAQAAFPSLNL